MIDSLTDVNIFDLSKCANMNNIKYLLRIDIDIVTALTSA